MPYTPSSDLPDYVAKLPKKKRDQWIAIFNQVYADTLGSAADKEKAAFKAANGVVFKKKEGQMPENILTLEEGKRQALIELHYAKLDIVESEEGKPLIIEGIASIADVVNSNNRLYPLAVLQSACDEVKANLDKSPGLVDHPSGTPSLADVGIRYTDLWMDGPMLKFRGEVVETRKGLDLAACVRAGVSVGISTRGYGSVRKGEWNGQSDVMIIQSDYSMEAPDAVLQPSQDNARITRYEADAVDYSTVTVDGLELNRPDLIQALTDVLTEKITQGLSNMNEDNIEEKELNTEPMVEKEPVVEPVAETIAEETLVEKTETLVEENPLQAELTEAKSKVDALMAELEDAKSKVEETKNVLALEIANTTCKYEETAEKLTEVEAEKTALAEDVANMKTLIDLCAKEIGEKAKSKDFYGAQSMAMMGGEMQYMHDREMQKSMESLVTAAESVVSALGVQNMRDYIVQRCRPERYSYPLADELMKVCTSKEDVEARIDDVRARVESQQVSSRPTTKGIVYNTESALSDTDRAALDKIRELRGYR